MSKMVWEVRIFRLFPAKAIQRHGQLVDVVLAAGLQLGIAGAAGYEMSSSLAVISKSLVLTSQGLSLDSLRSFTTCRNGDTASRGNRASPAS